MDSIGFFCSQVVHSARSILNDWWRDFFTRTCRKCPKVTWSIARAKIVAELCEAFFFFFCTKSPWGQSRQISRRGCENKRSQKTFSTQASPRTRQSRCTVFVFPTPCNRQSPSRVSATAVYVVRHYELVDESSLKINYFIFRVRRDAMGHSSDLWFRCGSGGGGGWWGGHAKAKGGLGIYVFIDFAGTPCPNNVWR